MAAIPHSPFRIPHLYYSAFPLPHSEFSPFHFKKLTTMNTPLSPLSEKLITEFTCRYILQYEGADYARWQAMDKAIKHCELLMQLPVVQQCNEGAHWQTIADELTGAALALKHQLQQAETPVHEKKLTVTCFDADSLADLLTEEPNPEHQQWRAELATVQQQLRHGTLTEAEYNLLFAQWMDLMVVLHDIPTHHSFYTQVEQYQHQRNHLVTHAFALLPLMRNPVLTDTELIQHLENFNTLIDDLGKLDYRFLCCYSPNDEEAFTGGEALVLCEAVVPGER